MLTLFMVSWVNSKIQGALLFLSPEQRLNGRCVVRSDLTTHANEDEGYLLYLRYRSEH